MTILLSFLGLVASCGAQYASSGCGKTLPAEPGTSTHYTMGYDGYERVYIVHIPKNFNQNSNVGQPMVFAFPGYTISANYFKNNFGMDEQADEYNYLVVYTQGTSFTNPNPPHNNVTSWNDLVCGKSPSEYGPTCNPDTVQPVPRPLQCDDPDGNKCNWCNCLADDISWFEHLAQYIEQNYCVDMSREYALGFSQGGMMTHTVACELADRFAAATPFHGQRAPNFGCTPSDPDLLMPIMNVWGTRDQEVPGTAMESQDGWYYQPVNNVQETFAMFNGCDLSGGITDPIATTSDGIRDWACKGWNKDCKNNSYTMSCSWDGVHTYPMVNGYNFGLNVSWNFMSQFQRIPPKSKR